MKHFIFAACAVLLHCTAFAQITMTKKVGNDGTVYYVGGNVVKLENGESHSFTKDLEESKLKYEDGFFIYDRLGVALVMDKNMKTIIPADKYALLYGIYRDEVGNVYFHVGKQVKKKFLQGFCDSNGNEIVELKYEHVTLTPDGFKAGKNYKKAKPVDAGYGKINWEPYTSPTGVNGRRYKFKDTGGTVFYITETNGLKGLADSEGNEIIRNGFPCLKYDYNMQCLVGKNRDSSTVYLKTDGGRILENLEEGTVPKVKQYVLAGGEVKVFFTTSNNEGIGACDIHGNQLVENKYASISYSNERGFYESVWNDKKKDVVITHANVFLYDTLKQSVVYDGVGYCMILHKGKYGLLNTAGETIIPVQYGKITEEDGMFMAYKDDSFNSLCAAYTAEGLKVIDENRGYVDIDWETSDDIPWYRVAVEGKKGRLYGACDLRGNEIVPCEQKNLTFRDSQGWYVIPREKKRYLPVNPGDFITSKEKAGAAAKSLIQEALSQIKAGDYEKALHSLKLSIQLDDFNMNDAYYLLGHYYCFGVFGEAGLNGNATVNRSGLEPVNAAKGLDYLNAALSTDVADVFADKSAWTYNPAKAIRLYAAYSSIIGDVDGESKKIREVFLRDNDFDFDVEYFYNQTYQECVRNSDYTNEVADFLLWFPAKIDTIVSIADKIPASHKSAVLNATGMDNKDLLYMGMKYFNSRQFGQALYYFRRGAMHGDENCFSMSVMCLDSIARHYCSNASQYNVAQAFAEIFPFSNGNGRFKQKEEEFTTYYKNICNVIDEERERKRRERQQAEYQRKQAKRERNRAILGTILQGFAQGVQAYYNAKATNYYNNMPTPAIPNTGSALNTQIPEAFNPQRVAAMSQPVYSYDANGNMMVSYPGFSQALGEMNSEIQHTTQQVSSRLAATGDPYYIAKAQSLQTMANTNQWTSQIDQQFWSTPMYPGVYDEEDMQSIEDNSTETTDNGISDDTEDSPSGIGNTTYADADNDIQTSERKDTKRAISLNIANNNRRKTGSKKSDDKKLDSKIQFRQGKVSSDDYDVIKRNVTLYIRNGDKARPFMHNKELCRKGASYYIKLNNKYYLVGYSNWNRFNRSIMYGATSVYFDM